MFTPHDLLALIPFPKNEPPPPDGDGDGREIDPDCKEGDPNFPYGPCPYQSC